MMSSSDTIPKKLWIYTFYVNDKHPPEIHHSVATSNVLLPTPQEREKFIRNQYMRQTFVDRTLIFLASRPSLERVRMNLLIGLYEEETIT
mgnify:CR=1 FL=1